MRKKILIIIVISILMIIAFSTEIGDNHYNKWQNKIQETTKDDQSSPLPNRAATTAAAEKIATTAAAEGSPENSEITLKAAMQTYTSLSLSESGTILEGMDVTLNSRTSDSSFAIDEGAVDFRDLSLYKVDNDPSVSEEIYSRKFAIKITLPQTATIYGFIINIAPTIREDVNFYIRTSLTGGSLRNGVISGYATFSNQMLYVPFPYCGGASPLTIEQSTDYYFLLEPTASNNDDFFELRKSSNSPDDVSVYSWSGTYLEESNVDVRIYLITQINGIASNVNVNSNGEANAIWTAAGEGDHALLAWYKGTPFYSESFGSAVRSVVSGGTEYDVAVDSIETDYNDEVTLRATVEDESLPAVGKTVTFYLSEDNGQSWTVIGSAVTNTLGEASLTHRFSQLPGDYQIRAKVNELSMDEASLVINPEQLIWQNIDLIGNYRNIPGEPTVVELTTTLLVTDDDGEIVPNMAFDFWYLIDSEYVYVPHIFTTDKDGCATVLYSVNGLTVGAYQDTHYFTPDDFVQGYVGQSDLGNSVINKGILSVEIEDCFVKWSDGVSLIARVTSLQEPWESITVRFSYYADQQWHTIAQSQTNISGIAQLVWYQVDLSAGLYEIRAQTIENSDFLSSEGFGYLTVEKMGINLLIINSDGQAEGNGVEIELEFASMINFVYYVTNEYGQPLPGITIIIWGRLSSENYEQLLGYATTNASGYALFNSYEELELVGLVYSCLAEVKETGKHEGTQLYFLIDLVKCTPVIKIADITGEKGTGILLSASVTTIEGMPLQGILVEFVIHGQLYQATTDSYGFAEVIISPDFLVGQYVINCSCPESTNVNFASASAIFYLTRGTPYFTLFDCSAKKGDYLEIRVEACDSLGRPIPNLSFSLSFSTWSKILVTEDDGAIIYPIPTSNLNLGSYLLVLSFDGDDNWFDATVVGNVLIYEENSRIDLLSSPAEGIFGEEILFEVILKTDQGVPLDGRTVQFAIFFENGSLLIIGENTTMNGGVASLLAKLTIKPGSYSWGAIYPGSVDFGPSSAMTPIFIQRAPSTIIGTDFEAVVNSTATFQIALKDHLNQPISNRNISLYLWSNSSWIYQGEFKTNLTGIATLSIDAPASLGNLQLKVQFNGDDFYQSSQIALQMTVVEPPPKIVPEISLDMGSQTIADCQEISINITISNALVGSAVTLDVYVNGYLTETILVMNGHGIHLWNSPTIGYFNLTFVSQEDSVYAAANQTISIEVIQNIPPELLSYTPYDYICEGDPFFIEATFFDSSGIESVWLLINGSQYEMVFDGLKYSVTVYTLREAVYNIALSAIDKQGIMITIELDPLDVLERRTQVIKYHFNSVILEQGTRFFIEVLIYSENPLIAVYLKINSTEYQMFLQSKINDHTSIWYLETSFSELGYFVIEIKMVEENNQEFVEKLDSTIIVIASTPEIIDQDLLISSGKEVDLISGNITIASFYEIKEVEIRIDGILIDFIQLPDGRYSFSVSVDHAKNHLLKIKVIDVMDRVLEKEFKIEGRSGNILTISLVVSALVLIVLVVGGLFATKLIAKSQGENNVMELELSEIAEELSDEEQDSVATDLPDQEKIEQAMESDDEKDEAHLEIGDEADAIEIDNQSEEDADEPSIDEPFDLYDGLEEAGRTIPISSLATADILPTNQEPIGEVDSDLLESNELTEGIEIATQTALEEAREYLQIVKNNGLIEYANNSFAEENRNEEEEEEEQLPLMKGIGSITIEIDERLLPEEERQARIEQARKKEEDMMPLAERLGLKEIAEEIESTFQKKVKTKS